VQTYPYTLKTETEYSPESFVITSHITECHIPEDATFLIKFNFTRYRRVWSRYIWFQFHMQGFHCIPSVGPSFYWCILNRCSRLKTRVCGSWSVRGYANNAGSCIPTELTADAAFRFVFGLTAPWTDRGSHREAAERSSARRVFRWKSTDVSDEHIASIFSAFMLVSSSTFFFDDEDWGDMFLRNVGRYIAEDITIHNHQCESLRSYMNLKYSSAILSLCLKTK
jgi:hypothetical protein